MSTSGRFTAAARTLISASPGPGVGLGTASVAIPSGVPSRWQTAARIIAVSTRAVCQATPQASGFAKVIRFAVASRGPGPA